jgi:putative MATE family efflux protein
MDKQTDLVHGPIAPALARLFFPMLIGMVLVTSVSLVDAYFVGRLGVESLAAFGLCFPFAILTQCLLLGFSNGITTAVATARGATESAHEARNERLLINVGLALMLLLGSSLALLGWTFRETLLSFGGTDPRVLALACKYFGPLMVSTVIVSFPFGAMGALQGLGETTSSAIIMLTCAVVNALMVPVLIEGLAGAPALGIAGASSATAFAYAVAALVALVELRRKTRNLARRQAATMTSREAARSIASVGVSAMISQALGPVAAGFQTWMVTGFGTPALAALGVIQRIELVIMIVPLAMSQALVPIVGQCWGAKLTNRAASVVQLARRSMMTYAAVVWLTLIVGGAALASVFSQDPRVIQLAAQAFVITPVGYICASGVLATQGALTAIGRAQRAAMLSGIYTFISFPLFGYVLSRYAGLEGVFAGTSAGSVVTALLALRWIRVEGLRPNDKLAELEPLREIGVQAG